MKKWILMLLFLTIAFPAWGKDFKEILVIDESLIDTDIARDSEIPTTAADIGAEPALQNIITTGTQTLTAAQLTNSRIWLNHSAAAVYTFGTAQTAYNLEKDRAVFKFGTTTATEFTPAATDNIVYIDSSVHTLSDGVPMDADSPALYDSFTLTPEYDGTNYFWLIYCSRGTYTEGGL